MMSAVVMFLFEDGTPHSWGSLLGEGFTKTSELVELSFELKKSD